MEFQSEQSNEIKRDALCSENMQEQRCNHSDGHYILGRNFGLMVIKDALHNKILWRKYVRYETIKDYLEGVEWLKSQGFRIYGAVIDGMRGLAQALRPIPVQMCQFHKIMITHRYLTQDPDIGASKELLSLIKEITRMDKESFIGAFEKWYERNKDILNERLQISE